MRGSAVEAVSNEREENVLARILRERCGFPKVKRVEELLRHPPDLVSINDEYTVTTSHGGFHVVSIR